jgi:hypothetical protein
MSSRGDEARTCGIFPSLPLMGRVADSLLSAGWGEPHVLGFPPTHRADRLGFAEIGARRPPHVGGGMEQEAGCIINQHPQGHCRG